MDINKLSNTYTIKQLNEDDIKDIISLMMENKQFYKYHPENINEDMVKEELTMLPENKTLDDKYYLGFYDGNKLICILELIEKYPSDNYCYIGFFMMDKEYQGKGIGSKIIDEVVRYLKKLGYTNIRLGIDKDNPQSSHFWTKNKFIKTLEEVKQGIYTYYPMERKL